MATTVYFATNRVINGDPTNPNSYSADIVHDNPAAVTYGVATVDNIDLPNDDAGTITALANIAPGNWQDDAIEAIVNSGTNLLIFIHGFANTFEEAITRAAFNAFWFSNSGVAAANTTVLTFTWPSSGQEIGSVSQGLNAAYEQDQTMAGQSGYHLGYFINNVSIVRNTYKASNPNGRIFLLAHSMGNLALQSAVQWWFASGGGMRDLMFDEALLAAADELYTTFLTPDSGRLSRLPDLASRISVYYSRNDVVMWLSNTVNNVANGGDNTRLGYDGPFDEANLAKYPIAKFRLIDCSNVFDLALPVLSLETHQYYRLSKTVRADIVSVIAGNAVPAGGTVTLRSPPAPVTAVEGGGD